MALSPVTMPYIGASAWRWRRRRGLVRQCLDASCSASHRRRARLMRSSRTSSLSRPEYLRVHPAPRTCCVPKAFAYDSTDSRTRECAIDHREFFYGEIWNKTFPCCLFLWPLARIEPTGMAPPKTSGPCRTAPSPHIFATAANLRFTALSLNSDRLVVQIAVVFEAPSAQSLWACRGSSRSS